MMGVGEVLHGKEWCKLSKVTDELFPAGSHLCYQRVIAAPPVKENPKTSSALQQRADLLAVWTPDNCCNSRLCMLQKTSSHNRSHGNEKNQWAKKPTPLQFIHQAKQSKSASPARCQRRGEGREQKAHLSSWHIIAKKIMHFKMLTVFTQDKKSKGWVFSTSIRSANPSVTSVNVNGGESVLDTAEMLVTALWIPKQHQPQ